MSIDTKELLNKLSTTDDIQKFLIDYNAEFIALDPIEFMNEVFVKKDMSLAEVSRKSGQGEYVYKVFKGERKPSRDVLIAIAIGMQMSINEIQLLLRISKYAALDPRNKRDSIIIYSLKESHTVAQTNDLLYELSEQTL